MAMNRGSAACTSVMLASVMVSLFQPAVAGPPVFGLGLGPSLETTLLRPVAIFGADDRVLLPSRLAALQDKIGLIYEPRSRAVCTAFCIDQQTVATAAHCLFRTRGEKALPLANIVFRLGARPRQAQSRIAGVGSGAGAQNVMSGSVNLSTRPPIDATRDWALIRLATPVCEAGGLPLSHRTPGHLAADEAERTIYQVGYHGDFGNWALSLSPPCSVQRPAQTREGKLVAEDFADSSTLILHTCDTGGASSGSPLLIDGPRGPEVVGINVGTYLQSRVLTQDGAVVHRYKSETVANTAVSTQAFLAQSAVFTTAEVVGGVPDLRRIQSALTLTGHYIGPIDGLYGPGTRQAITDFEKGERRLPTGLATRTLLRRLQAVVAARGIPDLENAPGLLDRTSTGIETGSVGRPTSGRRQPD